METPNPTAGRWLWASLKRAGKSDKQVLVWTTLAFVAWHISAISLDTGFGEKAGALGIDQTHIFGPEVGILGIVLNLLFFTVFWRRYATQTAKKSPEYH